jgi:prepilin-type N-terminal cleavage/methylation domain-containing protein/prepilin-type processing-associated H-X9-DG protein
MKIQRFGFTLIELLVVIAIIAILAAILFPVFAQAREKARAVSCLSNEKQIGLAFMQYNQDNDELFPAGYQQGGAGHFGRGWAGAIYIYAKSQQLFKCPDDPTGNYVGPDGSIAPAESYLANLNLLETSYATPSPASLAQMAAPAKTVLLCEFFGQDVYLTNAAEGNSPVGTGVGTVANAGNYETGYLGGRDASAGNAGYASGQFPNKQGVHNGGSNFLLADGHAKWLNGAKVSSGAWNAANSTDDQMAPCTTGSWSQTSCAAAGVDNSKFAATFSIQ